MLTNYSSEERQKGMATLNIPGVVFNYLDEETKEWKVQTTILRPVTITYRYDKALDDANVAFISEDIKHKLPNLTKCRIIHESSEPKFNVVSVARWLNSNLTYWNNHPDNRGNGNPTDNGIPEELPSNYVNGYALRVRNISTGKDEYYQAQEAVYSTPKNFDEFIIIEGTCLKQGISGTYKHQYHLVEPIELLKYVRMETLSFTNKTSIDIYDPVSQKTTTYVKDPLNYLSIIQRILAVTGTKTSVEDTTWTNRIKIHPDTAALLKAHGVENDEVFTENTLYDALFYIGTCINRVPVIYFNYEDASYEFTLYYERVDGLDKPQITEEELYKDNLGWVESQMPNSQADTIVCDVQNGVPSHVSSYPMLTYPCVPTGDINSIELKDSDQQKIYLPYKIREIVSVLQIKTLYDEKQGAPYTKYVVRDDKQIKAFTYNDWLVQKDREDCVYYKEGDNVVLLGSNIPRQNGNQSNTYFYLIKYYPLFEGKLSFTKGEVSKYQTTFNLTNTLADLDNLGNVLKSYANENGGVDLLIKKYIKREYCEDKSRWGEAYQQIWQPGTRIKLNNGQIGLIATTSIETCIEGYKVNYQINTNFIKRNEAIRASQRIRQQGLDYDTTYNRYTNISETIKVGFSVHGRPEGLVNNAKYLQDKELLFLGLVYNSSYLPKLIQTCGMEMKLKYKKQDNPNGINDSKYIANSFLISQSGKSIILNTKLMDNFKAGITRLENPFNYIRTTNSVKYTDPFGYVDKITIIYSKFNNALSVWPPNDPPQGPAPMGTSDLSSYNEYKRLAHSLPSLEQDDYQNMFQNSIIRISDLMVQKDTGEILNITYQLHFDGYKDTSITPELLKYSGLLGNINAPNLYLVLLKPDETINSGDIIIDSQIHALKFIQTKHVFNDAITLGFSEDGSESIDIIAGSQYALCTKLSSNTYQPLIINNGGVTKINVRSVSIYV